MILNQIQKKIEETYQIDCPASVEEFLLEDEYRKEAIRGQPWLAFTDEALLVAQDEEANLEVGLFYSPKLLQWAEGLCWEELSKVLTQPEVLKRFGPLVEGVSHFVYLLWRVGREEPVTQLELELQAEIDKFVLFSREMNFSSHEKIFEQLFSENHWIDRLSLEQTERYQTANRLASQYCVYLSRYYPQRIEGELLEELRGFYRMRQADKIRHIL